MNRAELNEAEKAILDHDPIVDYGDPGLVCFWCSRTFEDFRDALDVNAHAEDCTWAIYKAANPDYCCPPQ